MASELQLLVDVWEAVRDYLPTKARNDAAVGIIRAMAEFGFEASDLANIVDEGDPDLTTAFEDVFGDPVFDPDEDYED